MNKVFQTNDCPYHVRSPRILASKHKSTMKYGINAFAFKGSQIWQKYSPRNTKPLTKFAVH